MGMVREDILTTYFGINRARAANRKADTLAERAC